MIDAKERSRLCIECQWCCKYMIVPMPHVNKQLFEIYRAWGAKIRKEHGAYYAVIPFPCQHITDSGCAIYDKRPFICKQFIDATAAKCTITWPHCAISQRLKKES